MGCLFWIHTNKKDRTYHQRTAVCSLLSPHSVVPCLFCYLAGWEAVFVETTRCKCRHYQIFIAISKDNTHQNYGSLACKRRKGCYDSGAFSYYHEISNQDYISYSLNHCVERLEIKKKLLILMDSMLTQQLFRLHSMCIPDYHGIWSFRVIYMRLYSNQCNVCFVCIVVDMELKAGHFTTE